jgi:putative peptidoglycan lipid II flippase
VHAGDKTQAWGALDEATVFCLALALPAAAALVSMPFFIIDGLYTRGQFKLVDAHNTAMALQQYGWGLPAFVIAQITNRAFFAQQDTMTPMRVGLVSVAVNVALGVTLFHFIGATGIAAATSAAWWMNVIVMTVMLARRGIYAPSAEAWSRLARILAASVALGLLLAAASHFRPLIESPFQHLHLGPLHAKEISVVLVSIAAVVIYPLLLLGSGGLTMAQLRRDLSRRPADPPPEALP